MRNVLTMGTIAAMTLAAGVTMGAQAPAAAPPQAPTSPATDIQRPISDTAAKAATQDQVVTVTGCLHAEKDVPGLHPNVAERAGVGEDYILTNTKMAPGSSTSAIGLAMMYKVKGVSDSELKNHLGHQIEVTGKPAAKAGAAKADLPDLEASSVKMIAATCPAK